MSKAKIIGGAALALSTILGAIYAKEGGFVNDPADPGGATRYGITERVARQHGYAGDMRHFPKHCNGSAAVCADEIYIEKYVKPMTGDLVLLTVDPAVSEELADTAVNMGLQRPSRWFQATLRGFGYPIAVDGQIGGQTIRAAIEYRAKTGAAGCIVMLDALDAKQRAEYDRLVRVNPALRKFHRGWVAHRVGNVDRRKCGDGF